MKRDISKAIKDGKEIMTKREKLGLRTPELIEIKNRQNWNHKDAVINAIYDAYAAGLAIGQRNK